MAILVPWIVKMDRNAGVGVIVESLAPIELISQVFFRQKGI